jgi:ferredoxin
MPYLRRGTAGGSSCARPRRRGALRRLQPLRRRLPRRLHRPAGDRGRARAPLPGVLPHQLLALHLLRLCEEACPTYAIQLTPDFEMGEYDRSKLVYEKEDLTDRRPGKYPEYNFYRHAGLAIGARARARASTSAARRRPQRCCRGLGSSRGASPSTLASAVALVATLMVITAATRCTRCSTSSSRCSPWRHLPAARRAVRGGARGHRLRRRDHGAVRVRDHAARHGAGGDRAGAALAAGRGLGRPGS